MLLPEEPKSGLSDAKLQNDPHFSKSINLRGPRTEVSVTGPQVRSLPLVAWEKDRGWAGEAVALGIYLGKHRPFRAVKRK